MLGVFAFVSACDSHPREAKTPDPPLTAADTLEDPFAEPPRRSGFIGCHLLGYEAPPDACAAPPRPVAAWGAAPLDAPPDPYCPMQVRVTEDGVIAEPFKAFDPMSEDECVPPKYQIGTRRTLRVDDGTLVAYAGAFDGDLSWHDEDGNARRSISGARFVAFARAPSGTVIALGVGRARLGHGGVVALDRRGHGDYVPRLVSTLPVQPSAASATNDGRLLAFAQGFILRLDEAGKVENLHYLARDVGRVASVARSDDGVLFLGLECGVLRLVPRGDGQFYEEWWSARDGASGHWSACP